MTYRISPANTGTGFADEIYDIGQSLGVITASRSDRGQTSRTVLAMSELLCVDTGRFERRHITKS